MTRWWALGAMVLASGASPAVAGPGMTIAYTLHVTAGDTTGFDVTMQVSHAPAVLRVAMMHHPEYDDRYWRFVSGLRGDGPAGAVAVVRRDSALWEMATPDGIVTLHYRIQLPPATATRVGWRAFLTSNGGLVGGPHSFMYVVGAERAGSTVRLELPAAWDVATGLDAAPGAGRYRAASAAELFDSPMLVGALRNWRFVAGGVVHRVAYLPLPHATPFDTAAFVDGLSRVARQAIAIFGSAPYPHYTYLFVDGAFGGLQHANSVSIGAESRRLAADPDEALEETAHEYFHAWNEVRIRPVEDSAIDYRTPPPTPGVWWYEGTTMLYADLLLRRAGRPREDSTRLAHLERIMATYFGSSGDTLSSPEQASLVANSSDMMASGDDNASVHVQGELVGTMLDLIVRNATAGRRSLDDVMRLVMQRYSGARGYTSADLEQSVDATCGCVTHDFFERYVRSAHAIDFNQYLALIGLEFGMTTVPAIRDDGTPAPDAIVTAWLPTGASRPRLRVFDRTSAWVRAGLHTGDTLVAVNGTAVTSVADFRAAVAQIRIGDSVHVLVGRASGAYQAAFVMPQRHEVRVSITERSDATPVQRALRAAWLALQ